MRKIQLWTIAESSPSKNKDFEEGIGPYALARIAIDSGLDLEVFQASQYNCNEEKICKEIINQNPDILAFSIFSPGVSLLEKILKRVSNYPIIIGGPGATTNPVDVLKRISTYSTGNHSVLVQGEGEKIFRNHIINRKSYR